MTSRPLYPSYLPTRPDGYAPPIELPPFDGTEPGSQADPAKPSLFKTGSVISNITPRVGSEITGVQISQLSHKGLDELALLAAERGVVVFVRFLYHPRPDLTSITRIAARSGLCGYRI